MSVEKVENINQMKPKKKKKRTKKNQKVKMQKNTIKNYFVYSQCSIMYSIYIQVIPSLY